MLDIFPVKKDIPFMSYGKLTTTISLATFVIAVFFLFTKGLHLSIEFTGGTAMEVRYAQAADVEKIRGHLNNIGMHDSVVQTAGTTREVRLNLPLLKDLTSAQIADKVMTELKKDAQVDLVSVEFVGPSVGNDLVRDGVLAITFLCIGIMLYLAMRFEWRFAVSAIIANMHDMVIILGVFAFFQWEFSLTVLAAVLAVLGYSVNESVVVFDRIRENFRTMRTATVPEMIDNAITRTMSRTLITHGSTEIMVLAMLLFGGPSLHYFAIALTIGILFGIYSSVLVGSPLLLMFGVSREHFIVSTKPKEEAVV